MFVSGYNEVIEVAKKLEFDVYGVFMKPFDPNVMEKLAESDDHAHFIQNSIEMPPSTSTQISLPILRVQTFSDKTGN